MWLFCGPLCLVGLLHYYSTFAFLLAACTLIREATRFSTSRTCGCHRPCRTCGSKHLQVCKLGGVVGEQRDVTHHWLCTPREQISTTSQTAQKKQRQSKQRRYRQYHEKRSTQRHKLKLTGSCSNQRRSRQEHKDQEYNHTLVSEKQSEEREE